MEAEESEPVRIEDPLLQPNGTQQHQEQSQRLETDEIDGDDHETRLDTTLQRLEFCLSFLGFNQTSILSFVLSWVGFLVIGVAVPVMVLELSHCSGCEEFQVKDFEFDVVGFQACLGAVSLICLSHNLRKYGVRKFLFVDRFSGQMSRFMHQYIAKIRGSYRMLILWLLPCFILKSGREIIRIIHVHNETWWRSTIIVSALVMSWTYVSAIFLAACILFHLVCNLQVIHFEDYGKLLEKEANIMVLINEHIRLRHYLSKISHRFRIFLLLVFLVVTGSQCITLFQITGYGGTTVTFLNGGDFAVTSIVQVVGIILCLHAGTKISHKAQGIASVASKWHASVTCSSLSDEPQSRRNSALDFTRRSVSLGSLPSNLSESDLESLDSLPIPTHSQLASSVSSYNKRQSFLMYLQMNPGGITLYGWTVDRALLTTIFFIELSLVLFVLGQTFVFPSEPIP